jgi:hypothetical protein
VYKVAEEQIRSGLSAGARLLLGLFAAVFGIVMILIAPPTDNAFFFYAFGGFCLIVGVACATRGRLRQFIGSVIGSVLFCASAWYIVAQVISGPIFSGSRSQPSVVNALLFFLAFGVPGIAYALSAKFGITKREPNAGP